MAFKNDIKTAIADGADVVLYTCPAGAEASIHTLFLDAQGGSATATLKITLQSTGETTTFLDGYSLTDNGPFTFPKPINMTSGDSLSLSASQSNIVALISAFVDENAGATSSFNLRGAYNITATYNKFDVITFNGTSFVAASDNIKNSEPPSVNWIVLASKGDEGDQGITGNTGSVGDTGAKGDTGDTGAKGDTPVLEAGTGITVSGATITNALPDQTVVLTGSTGISTSGTYPNFTVTNTAPHIATNLTYGTASTTGTVNSSTGTNATLPAATTILAGLMTGSDKTKLDGIAAGATTNTGTVTSVAASAGTGISVSGSPITTSGTLTITNTAPDQTVTLTGSGATSISGSYPDFTVSSTDTNTTYTAGTGLSLAGTILSNTAPDQTVVLTQGANVTITGTYPNFTIASSDQFNGTVTSVGGTGTVNGLSLSGTITSTGSLALGGTLSVSNSDWSGTGLSVSNGGTGVASLTPNTVLLGSGTSAVQTVAPSTSGNVLTSNGTTWVSQPVAALDTQTATTNSTAQTAISTYPTASFDAAKVVIIAENGTDKTASELLITWKGTVAYATEYAVLNTAEVSMASYDVDVLNGSFRILATAATSNSTNFIIKAITI